MGVTATILDACPTIKTCLPEAASYRLAGRRLGDPQLAVGVCVLYLLFPAVQFNALLDFRPDFVEAEQSKRAGDHQDSGGRRPLAAWRLRFDLSRAL